MPETYVPAIANIAALQASTTGTLAESECYVLGYYSAGDGGEGSFVVGTTIPTADTNNGTTVNDSSSRTWYRQTEGQPISVRWFGATGNGSTDDEPSINAALNAFPTSGGSSVYFPAGTYLIGAVLTIPTTSPPLASPGSNPTGGMTITGAGIGISVITHDLTNTKFMTCNVASNDVFFNLRVEGLTFYAQNTTFRVFHVETTNVINQVFENCQFWSLSGNDAYVAGLSLNGSGTGDFIDPFYAYVKNCVFEGSSIQFNNVTDSWVTDNVIFAENGVNTGCRAYGIKLLGNASDIKIERNHIQSALDGGIYIASTSGYNSLASAIRNNFFDTNSTTASAIAINITSQQENFVISGNCFSGVPGTAISATDLSYSTINGNTFYSCGTGGYPTIAFSKATTGCIGNVVSGNIFFLPTEVTPAVVAIDENASSSGQNVYGPNSIAGSGYSSQPITFDSSSGDALIIPWAGLITKAGGNVTVESGSTSVTASHNLAYTPNPEDFSLTNISGWGSANKVWISSVTATQFTVNVDVAPGSAITFGYRVEYRGNFSDS